jgi:ABC-2 type transport system permease protein
VPTPVVTLVAFLNLGLAGFVLAAIAARFLFPSVSLEGRQMWLLRSSPLDLRSMLWSKYWIGTLPLLILALAITLITNAILRASPFITFVSAATMVLFTLAASALALSFGAFYPRFDTENAAQIPTSFGGLVYMMTSVILLALVIMLEAPAVATQIQAEQGGGTVVWGVGLLGPLAAAVVLCVAATLLPLRLALARMERLEF